MVVDVNVGTVEYVHANGTPRVKPVERAFKRVPEDDDILKPPVNVPVLQLTEPEPQFIEAI